LNQDEKPVIICGVGGHARVIADSLIKSKRKILGFIAPNSDYQESIFGLKILGDDTYLGNYSVNEVVLANGIGSLPRQDRRWNFASEMRSKGYSFTKVIHSSVIIGESIKLEEGVQIMAGSVIQTNVSIGSDTIINTGVLIDHDCNIGKECHIAPGVVCSGGVSIGQRVHLGTGSKVIENISLGESSIIAAGSVIYNNVPANTTIIQKRQSSKI